MNPVIPHTVVDAGKLIDPVTKSVERESAFSKPGHTGKGKGWSPAKGVRFRPTNEKPKGRLRKRKPDARYVKYY